MKKFIFVPLIIGLITFGLIITYFRADRNQFLKSGLNNFLAGNPAVRWQGREALVTLEHLILIPVIFFSPESDKLPSISLSVNFADLQKLDNSLSLDKFNSHLSDQNKKPVPAIFSTGGQTHQAQVRYRGDNYNHWAFQKKSWRVQLTDGSYEGMRTFNLIIPEDGGFVQELFYMRLAKRLNLISPKAFFVTMQLNGESKKIYLLVEQRSKIMVETNRRPEGYLIGESNLITPYDSVHGVQVYDFAEGDYFDLASIDYLQQLIKESDDEKFNRLLPTVLDMDSAIRWIAVSTAMFSRAQKNSHNFLTYLNPTSGKLELIPWNADMSDLNPKDSPIDTNYNTLVSRILKNQLWHSQRNRYVLQLIGNDNQLKNDLLWVDQTRNSIRPAVLADEQRLFLFAEFEVIINQFKDRYAQAYRKLTQELK